MENKFDISNNAHPRDVNIFFREEGHIYTIKGFNGKTISVTTLIKKYFPEFNADEAVSNKIRKMTTKDKYYSKAKEFVFQYYPELIIEKLSLLSSTDELIILKIRSLTINDECYQKITQYIKDDWGQTGGEASTEGTAMHKDIEHFFLHLPIKNPDSKEFKMFLDFWKDITTMYPTFYPYRAEWVIGDETIGLCGSIDLVLTDKDGNLIIIDWKRSKEIKFENKWQKAAAPFQSFDDCNFSKYSLQLNLYRHMLENKYDKKVVLMLIVVLHPNQEKYLPYPVERIDLTNVWHKLV